MILMSVDGSTKASGVAIFKEKKLIHYECITDTSSEKIKRINHMSTRLQELFKEYKVDKVILEEPLPEDVKNNKKVFKALMYLQAKIVIDFYNELNYKFEDTDFIPVNTWRSKLGITIGRSGIREAVKKEDINFVKNNYSIDVNDDIADGICIGHAYLSCGGQLQPATKPRKKIVEESAF
jgi:Holliday junction resolvasome RuvABC endonuclease subunit